MNNFEFVNPTKILFGKGQVESLSREIPMGSKVLILYGGGSIKKIGLLDKVKKVLKDYEVGEFGGIEPNPVYETLMKAVEKIRKEKYDFLLAVGGGSVIDGTKFVAAAALFTMGEPCEMLIKQLPVTIALPLGTVLTLSGTGSEMDDGAVISIKSEKVKIPFHSSAIFPRFSVLDPSYTYSVPTKQIRNGIVDTFVHVLEQYLTYPVNAKIQDRLAEGILLTVIEEGPKALANPNDYGVRSNLMWASTMAMNGLIGSGVPQDWSTHIVGHGITALYGLDHGQTLAIVLPAMLEVQKTEKRDKLLQYAERVWDIKGKSQEDTTAIAIQKTREFFESVGVSTRLSSYGLGKAAIPKVVEALEPLESLQIKLGENGTLTLDGVQKVLELAL
jgi:NADP-dependent alcohol dehydrogenase